MAFETVKVDLSTLNIGRGRSEKYPLRQLQVGEGFVVEGMRERQNLAAAIQYYRKTHPNSSRFTVRHQGENKYLCVRFE